MGEREQAQLGRKQDHIKKPGFEGGAPAYLHKSKKDNTRDSNEPPTSDYAPNLAEESIAQK